jgi:flagellar basal body rod protein FlgF
VLTLITTVRFLEWSSAVKIKGHTHDASTPTAAAAAAVAAAAAAVTDEDGSEHSQEIVQLLNSCIKTSSHVNVQSGIRHWSATGLDREMLRLLSYSRGQEHIKRLHGPGTHEFLQGSALNFDLVKKSPLPTHS